MKYQESRTLSRFLIGLLGFVFLILFGTVLLAQTSFVLTQKSILPKMGSLLLVNGIRDQLGLPENQDVAQSLNKMLSQVPDTSIKPIKGFDFSVSYQDVKGKTEEQLRKWLEQSYLEPFYDRGVDYLREMTSDKEIRSQLDYALQQTSDPEYFTPAYIHSAIYGFRTAFLIISILLLGFIGFLAIRRARLIVPGVLLVLAGFPGFVLTQPFSSLTINLGDKLGWQNSQVQHLMIQLKPFIQASLNAYVWSFVLGVGLIILGLLLGFLAPISKEDLTAKRI